MLQLYHVLCDYTAAVDFQKDPMVQPDDIRLITEEALAAALAPLGGGSNPEGVTTRTSSATLTTADTRIQLVDATAGAVTTTLPTTTTPGIIFTVKKTDSSANQVTVAVGGSGNFDAIGPTFGLPNRNHYVTVVSTSVADVWRILGTNWYHDAPHYFAGALSTTGVTMADAANIGLGTTTGTKFGTATNQKLGFFNATPVVQQTATADLGVALSTLGLRAVGTAFPITTTGVIAANGAFRNLPTNRTANTTFTAGTTQQVNTVDATSGPLTMTLTATANAGYRFLFIKTDSTANTVTLAGTISGATNYVLSARYQWVEVISTTVSGEWNIVDEGGPQQPATKTTTATLTTNEKGTVLADATSAAFTITGPATTVPGIEFTVKKTDNGTNIVTIGGTFLNPSGNITNLKLYVPNQYHRFVTTTTSGTFRPLESSPVHAPAGTSTTGLPDGTIFMEY